MKIKSGFVLQKVGESYLACATGDLTSEFRGLVRMNGTGAFIFKLISEKNLSKEEIVFSVAKEYDVSEDVVSPDVDAFLKTLSDNGILED